MHPDCYPGLKDAWMAGKAFFVGRSLHDDEIVVKLSAIESIQRFTAEGQQGQRDEEAADRRMTPQ